MQESLLREIDTAYEAQRAQNHAEEQRRLAEASAADSMIGGLVAERMRLFQQGARRALSDPENARAISETLTEKVAAIQGELRDRLRSAGFAADYLQPVYACTLCHDTGFVGDPIRERCSCFQRRLRARQMASSGAGLNQRETFEAYDGTLYPDAPLSAGEADSQRSYTARIRDRCEAYADAFPNTERPNLLLAGMSGLGKTFLLNAIGNRARARGAEVMKVTAYQLTERMRASLFDRQPEAFSILLEMELLLLDDLGVEPLFNNITIEQLFTLLNERHLNGRHTVISTNLMPDELKGRYTERVCSRLFDRRSTLMLRFRGEDVRLL